MRWCCQGSTWLWWTLGAAVVIILGTILTALRHGSSCSSEMDEKKSSLGHGESGDRESNTTT